MIRLFTTWYPCHIEERLAELTKSLQQNLACAAVDQICVLREQEALLPFEDKKIRVRELERRPMFDDFFGWINELQGSEDIAVIANADIWLNETVFLAQQYLSQNQCWALARWDSLNNKQVLFDRNDSQDTWFFRGPLRKINANFPLGGIRSDNRLLHELKTTGYEVQNPAFNVITRHEHNEPPREYPTIKQANYVDGPYAYLWPHNLLSFRETLKHNAQSSIKIHWRIDPRKIERSLPVRAWAYMRRGFRRTKAL